MEHFVENDEHTLFDYRYKCRVCLIKLETEESFKLDKELKSKFYTITGLKLRSNRNYSNILCLICQRDLLCFCYFKERATKIQMYLNKKGEDCINGSETEDEAMIEGFPTFFLNDEDELSETTHTDKSIEIETEIISRKMNSIIVLENILIQPSVSCCTSEPKPITEEFDMKNQRPLEALQLKPSIPDQNNSDKKENKAELMKNINSIEKPSKQVLQTKEKHELPSNTKNVSIDTNIQNTENVEKSLKKGFPKICSRRQSVRVLSRVKIEKPIVHARPIDKKLPSTIEPMQTRSKTNSKRCKTDVIVQVLDFQDPKPKKKVATKMPKIPITHEIFACPGPCYRVFSYKNNLFRHQRKSHPEIQRPPKIKLQIADKSPIRPHQCQICKKYYETTTLLNNHELSVHNKKRYCKYQNCNQFFYTKFNLKSHVAIHLVSDINICEYCGLTGDEINLKRHKLTHVVSQLHCTLCNKNFRLLKSLKNHIKTIHNFSETKINKTFGGLTNRGRRNSIM